MLLTTDPGQHRPQRRQPGARSASAASGRSRTIYSKASVSGRYSVLASAGTARPVTANTPRRVACPASSRTSRDLPIPGSPVTSTKPPLPNAEPASASSKSSSSSWPITTGHSATPTRPVCHRATSGRTPPGQPAPMPLRPPFRCRTGRELATYQIWIICTRRQTPSARPSAAPSRRYAPSYVIEQGAVEFTVRC
jgi:hypothetical protein